MISGEESPPQLLDGSLKEGLDTIDVVRDAQMSDDQRRGLFLFGSDVLVEECISHISPSRVRFLADLTRMRFA